MWTAFEGFFQQWEKVDLHDSALERYFKQNCTLKSDQFNFRLEKLVISLPKRMIDALVDKLKTLLVKAKESKEDEIEPWGIPILQIS